jgi:hypothetical protein
MAFSFHVDEKRHGGIAVPRLNGAFRRSAAPVEPVHHYASFRRVRCQKMGRQDRSLAEGLPGIFTDVY